MSARGLTAAAWGERLARDVKVVKPAGRGPFPVSLQFHGCGGLMPMMDHYAEAAVKAGVAAVIIDSFKPRGMSRLDGHLFVCSGAMLRGSQRAADVHAMLAWLETQGWADRKRIAAAGWLPRSIAPEQTNRWPSSRDMPRGLKESMITAATPAFTAASA